MVDTTARIGLYSDSSTVGGAERSMLHLLSAYSGDAELILCTPSEVFIDEASRVAPCAKTHLFLTRGPLRHAVFDHRRVFRELDLDLLQVTLCNPFTARAAQLAGFSLRIPTVAVEQLVLPSRRRRGSILKRIVSRPLAAHVAVGNASADDLHRLFGIRRSSVRVIHNGVPDEPVKPHPFDARPVIGCAARLEDQKGLEHLIDAMVEIPDARLVLVGDGSVRSDLEHRVVERALSDRVEFVGWVTDARSYIAGFDLFVLPSRAESFPLTIVEAMMSGVPVIATDVGSVSDAVVTDHSGILVPPGDVRSLVGAIKRLLLDDALCARLARSARELAAGRFTDVAMARAYDSMWSDLLERPRRRHV